MRKKHDFTEGNIVKQLIFFSWPIMLANLLQTSYQFIDSLWIGNLLGAKALGAVAVSSTIIFTVLSFVIGLNNAALTILSQQKGMDNEGGLKRYLNAFVVILTIMALCLGAVGHILADKFLVLLGTPENMMQEATAYLRINFLGILFLFGYNFISTVLRALGDSKTPMYFVTVAVLLNIVLDPLFIAGFNWGGRRCRHGNCCLTGECIFIRTYFCASSPDCPIQCTKASKLERSKINSQSWDPLRNADGCDISRLGSNYECGYLFWRKRGCRLRCRPALG